MLINADFMRRAIVVPEQYQWVQSPQRGVERVMLDRVGVEKARATSIVRYAPESYFPAHSHPGGEEILVLSGTFSDGDQHFPTGWYLRNPPGSKHQPFSEEGAVIFVKLQQMVDSEQQSIRINTNDESNWSRQGTRNVCPLFAAVDEQVCLLRLAGGQQVFDASVDGAELLVVSGAVLLDEQTYTQGSWLRLPAGDTAIPQACDHGATVYLKTGHLPGVEGAK